MVLSFLTMRRIVGILGLALPVVLVVGGLFDDCCVRPYLSDYYYSPSPILHGVFVGTMSALGVFLISYKGYPRKKGEILGDNWVATATGVGALGIAIFPIEQSATGTDCCSTAPSSGVAERAGHLSICAESVFNCLHIASALLFFLFAATMVCFLFTKGQKCYKSEEERRQKTWRNVIYWVCSGIISVSVVAMIVVVLDWLHQCSPYRPMLIFQTLAVWAFGAAWIVKGRTLWSDGAK